MNLQSLRTPALVLACGCIIMCISFGIRAGFGLFLQPISLAYIDVPWLLHVNSAVLLGGALGGTSFGIILAVIGRTVAPEKRSLYMGIATAAGSFGQFLLLPFTQALISAFDWHTALLVLAGIAALIIPLTLALAGKPGSSAQSKQSIGEALREA